MNGRRGTQPSTGKCRGGHYSYDEGTHWQDDMARMQHASSERDREESMLKEEDDGGARERAA